MFPSKKLCLPSEFAFVMKTGRWYSLFSFIFFVILLPLLSCQSDSICTFTCLPSRVVHFSLISAAATLNAKSDSLQDAQCHDTTNPAFFTFFLFSSFQLRFFRAIFGCNSPCNSSVLSVLLCSLCPPPNSHLLVCHVPQ